MAEYKQTSEEIKQEETKSGNGSRLLEITRILHRHGFTRRMTPIKLRLILEDLGPTYIKIGQIMSSRSDILPKEYCEELMKLRSDAPPMPFSELIEVIEESYGRPWGDVFTYIESKPLGAASIAQVHKAKLVSGEDVVVKVQRKGIYEIMRRDIGLLHRAVKLMPPIKIKSVVDLNMILDELWVVTQEEMNFLKEASNMEEFADHNRDVVYISSPSLFRQYTTEQVLVMEYVDGLPIDDADLLQENGYDLQEIAEKMVDNYVKQVLEDGFFHADPHPGNLRVDDGKIIYIDMGMMGRLSKRDCELLRKGVRGLAERDIGLVQDALMGLGDFYGRPDQTRLHADIGELVTKYGSLDFGKIDVVKIMTELMDIMRANQATMPKGFTMLLRGLAQMEGVLAVISPDLNVVQIASTRMKQEVFDIHKLKEQFPRMGMDLYLSAKNLVEIPTLTAKLLREYEKGQARVNLELYSSEEMIATTHHLVRNLVIGMCIAALLVSSSIICTTDMWPKVFGIPLLGAAGYFTALVVSAYVVLRYFWRKHNQKK